ncbi:hypothetical protein ACIQGZ_01820 [Streptomyces sp. NPDC092296]|uniref:hypothetical protein n=1 Tax=Streptomyces sp. NPDC092296 TaxID=3366012 RepID=UPI0038275C4A
MTDYTTPPAPPTAPPAAPPRRRRRRRAWRPLAAVLAAAVAGVGIGEVLLHTRYRDDTATAAPTTAPVTAAPSPSWGARSNGNHFGSLRDQLLPVPDDYNLGPDEGDLGNDTELVGAQLHDRLRQQLKGVPDKHRKEVEDTWNSLHVRAGGLRTYRADSGEFMAEMQLSQLNQQAATARTALSTALVDGLGAFRQGPAVPGHRDTRCILPPLEPSAQIDYMTCFAAEGDLLVTMAVTGTAPLDKDKAVALLKAQLDRLARPGAAV